MHLLYLDESGSAADPHQIHYIIAGISVYEKQSYWIASELDKIASRFNGADPSLIELHGSPMFGGKSYWRKVPKNDRLTAMRDALGILAASHRSNRVFGCVVRKSVISPQDPIEYAFEQLSSRFDYYLRRLHKTGDSQRGIIIFDRSSYETQIQHLASNFRTVGHTWDLLRNLAEVPLFIDSRASRLIQLADLIAYALFKKYEHQDDQFASIFSSRYDGEGGIIHGLFEKL